MEIKGKHIYITGANRGIGRALAKAFHKEGGFVHILCRNPDDSNLDDLRDVDGYVIERLDVSTSQAIETFMNHLEDSGATVDIWVNNAGMLTGGLIEDQDMDEVYQMIQVNLTAVIHLTSKVVGLMVQQQGSKKIINNASVSGVMNLPLASTYTAAKSGVVAFTRSLAAELEKTNVSTLALITPGIKTRMFDEISQRYGDKMDVSGLSSIPPEDYAREVIQAVKDDRDEYWPKGSVRWPLLLAQHAPKLFKLGASRFFDRKDG